MLPERLRHLLAAEGQHARVQPVAREVADAERALGLGDLVLVVREDQVGAAAVDVEGLAEVAVRHGRALDVPARAARAPGALPRRLARLRRLSTARSRAGCASARRPRCARPAFRSSMLWPDSCAVGGEARRPRSRRRRRPRRPGPAPRAGAMMSITSAMCSVARGSRSARRERRAPRKSTFIVVGVLARRPRRPSCPSALALSDDLVVDVGDVADEAQRKPAGAQVARDDVPGDHHARVADVAEVVDRRCRRRRCPPCRARAARTGPSCRSGYRKFAASSTCSPDESDDVERRRTPPAPAR